MPGEQVHDRLGIPLEGMIRSAGSLTNVKKSALRPGDLLFVRTVNSWYRLRVLSDLKVEASGGWFDKRGLSPVQTNIAGCTWGGSAIMRDLAVACGLCMEFGNRLITTPVQRVILIPAFLQN